MTALSELYETATTAALKQAIGATKITEAELPDGGTRCYIDWADGSVMKIDCTAEEVFFQSLVSETPGLYTKLCDTLPELFKERGVKRFRMVPGNDEAEAILRKRGDWQEREGHEPIVWVL